MSVCMGACLELCGICSHVPVRLAGRLLHFLHIFVAGGPSCLIPWHQRCLAHLKGQRLNLPDARQL